MLGKIAASTLVAALVSCALGCAQQQQVASPTLTSAEAPAGEVGTLPPLPGELVCRAKSSEGTAELALEWQGAEAKGLLRRVTPSGMVYVDKVRAEKAGALIVADEPSSTDLAVHAATVREHDGGYVMRLGDWTRPWLRCGE